MSSQGNFGIVVSGGPAPGINSVISSATIEAINCGFGVKGLVDGFKGITIGDKDAVIDLPLSKVTSLSGTGGSILGTSRFNPFSNADLQEKFLRGLKENKIDKLIVIGGEGSAFLSYTISKMHPEIKVVHVPKTIDNDLILPNQAPSFGFETARYAGTKILETIMVDAKTCRRWFLVTSMGRKAGFLALGLGIASGAHLTIIPEEYQGTPPTPEDVAERIFKTMKKRSLMGKSYGVVILAEGLLDCFDPLSSAILKSCPRDELGRIIYSQLELGDVLMPSLRRTCSEAKLDIKIITKNIGYELRCHTPVSFDIEYTKFLGYGAVHHIMNGLSGVMVTRNFDQLGYIKLEDMLNKDGIIETRKVDLKSDLYKVATSFMIK